VRPGFFLPTLRTKFKLFAFIGEMNLPMSTKTILAALLCSLLSVSLSAQGTAEQSDPEARKVLDKIRKKYEGYKSFEAAFTLGIEVPQQAKQTQKGTIGQEGDKFRLEMNDQLIIDDRKTTWVYLKKNNEVQVSNSDPNSQDAGFMTPKELLRRYQKGDFIYAITDKVAEGTQIITEIEFKPVDRKSEYSKFRVSINENAGSIQQIKAFAKDGSRYSFVVTRFTPNKTLGVSYFTFDKSKYPGVQVEDLRL
jgi:outer membrane lipoprotein-sorting protein